jgi:MFS family permease
LLDRFAPEALALAIFALVAAGLLLLALGTTAMALPGGVITGFAVGAELDLLAFLVSRHFAPALYGRAYGGVFGLFMVGGAIGPGMAGLLHDWFGSYQASLLASTGCVAVAALATLVLWRLHPVVPARGQASKQIHATVDNPAAL